VNVLNLYAGIGGNRKLWTDAEVTAVEMREDIAAVYRDHFPHDKVIIADAHQYLLDHYKEFDFIWSSPPCPTWSRANFWASKTAANRKKYYSDMKLYQEIIFLQNWYNGKWLVENVDPYCAPLIAPAKEIGRHLFWCNFRITDLQVQDDNIHAGTRTEWSELHGFDLSKYKLNSRKDQIYRNCVHPETGLHIFNCMKGVYQSEKVKQISIFG
jgi:DNA (cytosine-5)-methyltransferase 1